METAGSKLGSNEFVNAKQKTFDYLKTSSIPVEAVEPTLVYVEGRNDFPSKSYHCIMHSGTAEKPYQCKKSDIELSDAGIGFLSEEAACQNG